VTDEFPAESGNSGAEVVPVTPSSTAAGGKPVDSVDDEADPVRAALARAQRMSRSATRKPAKRRRRPDEDGDATGTARRGGYSGAWPDATDPTPIGSVAADLVADRGWTRPLSEARLFSAWAEIVGAEVAAHCSPSGLRSGELRVSAVSTAWATQLRLLQGTLLARIVAELGPDVVTRIVVTGPVGPSWKHGPRSVPGARGPRDTYG
jgi:predicted nucleic acid-binding Zn ribbon protein